MLNGQVVFVKRSPRRSLW